MLEIMGKRLLLEKSEILFDKQFSGDCLAKDWEASSGEWWVEDGWLNGRIRDNAGGLIYSRESYPGDIMLDFHGRTVPPCRNDLNFTFCAEGWDHSKNDAGIGYIAGLNGWWTGKTGVEKYPECRVQATTSLLNFEGGKTYHIQAGIVGGQCFIFVDGRLVVELKDQEPIDSEKYGKVGFGAYCSYIQVKDLKIYKLVTENDYKEYSPQF